MTKNEYIKLLNTAVKSGNLRLNLLIETICATGIRVSELKYITLEAVRQGVAVVSLKDKTRTVFIVRKLQKKLLRYAAKQNIKTGSIFITRNGKPMNRSNIWREMKKLCGNASARNFWGDWIKSFARVFYSLERDIVKLADILGHSNINTTRIYIVSDGNEHRKKLENMRLIM